MLQLPFVLLFLHISSFFRTISCLMHSRRRFWKRKSASHDFRRVLHDHECIRVYFSRQHLDARDLRQIDDDKDNSSRLSRERALSMEERYTAPELFYNFVGDLACRFGDDHDRLFMP